MMYRYRFDAALVAVLLALLAVACGGSPSTAVRLIDLGGEPCPESPFTCITLEAPMDYLDRSDDQEVEVQFAVLPAAGDSRGAFVTVVGGPGGSGIDDSVWQVDWIPEEIRNNYDIVFFDQRGVGLFQDPVCPEADEVDEAALEALGENPDWGFSAIAELRSLPRG